MAWLFLLAALACGAGAYLIGWPAWNALRSREASDQNAERYLAWRGRASSPAMAGTRQGPTPDERRRLWLAGLLAAAAVVLVVAFFVAS
jgi:threonine/homoserine/homoserine lactone efflux protein